MRINEIDVGELVEMLDNDAHRPDIIDIRDVREVTQGAIPDSVHIPMNSIPARLHEISDDKKVILVCRSGARSGHACAWLSQNGRKNVFNLRGGMVAWANSGLQMELPKSA